MYEKSELDEMERNYELAYSNEDSYQEEERVELWDEERKHLIEKVKRYVDELSPKQLGKFAKALEVYLEAGTGYGESTVLSNMKGMLKALSVLINADYELEAHVLGMLASIAGRLNEISLTHWNTKVKDLANKTAKAIELYFATIGKEMKVLPYWKYGYKYPKVKTQKLSRVWGTEDGADRILQDARELGYDVCEGKNETFNELVNRRLKEAIEKLKREEQWSKKFHSTIKYPSKGFDRNTIEAIREGKYKMDSKGNIVPVKKHKLSKDEDDEFEHARRGADAILSDS